MLKMCVSAVVVVALASNCFGKEPGGPGKVREFRVKRAGIPTCKAYSDSDARRYLLAIDSIQAEYLDLSGQVTRKALAYVTTQQDINDPTLNWYVYQVAGNEYYAVSDRAVSGSFYWIWHTLDSGVTIDYPTRNATQSDISGCH
jgi:hypothetical protein